MTEKEFEDYEARVNMEQHYLLALMESYPELVFRYTMNHKNEFARFCHASLPKDIQEMYPFKGTKTYTAEQREELLDALRKGKNK